MAGNHALPRVGATAPGGMTLGCTARPSMMGTSHLHMPHKRLTRSTSACKHGQSRYRTSHDAKRLCLSCTRLAHGNFAGSPPLQGTAKEERAVPPPPSLTQSRIMNSCIHSGRQLRLQSAGAGKGDALERLPRRASRRKGRRHHLPAYPVLRMPAAMPLMEMSSASRRRWLLGSVRSRRRTSTCVTLMGSM